MTLLWSPLALERVNEIADFIARDRPVAAEQWVEGIFAAVERLGEFPVSGREVPEVSRPDLQERLYGSYRIVYVWSRSRFPYVYQVRLNSSCCHSERSKNL